MSNEFVIENGILTEYHGPGGAVDVPAGVTEIGARAFNGAALTALTLPEGLTHIGTEAFSGCWLLQSAAFPAGLETIGDFAFAGCRELAELTLPEGLTFIDRSAFSRCTGLKHITLPQTLAGLGEFAFAGCRGLTELDLPAGLARIDRSAFSQCRGLKKVALPERLERLERGVFYGCGNLTEVTLPKGLNALSVGAFSGCDGLLRIRVHPENESFREINGLLCSRDGTRLVVCPGGLQEAAAPEGVTEIGPEAFYENRFLDRLALPSTLERIGEAAFCRCVELTEIHFPAGLRALGVSAFEGCKGLKHLVLPESTEEIEASAFRNCGGLLWISLPQTLAFDLHWFAAPHDPQCFSADHTIIPFATTRPVGEISSNMGARRAALGFIRAELDHVTVAEDIARGYTDYIRANSAALGEEMLSDDEILHWMLGNRMIPPEDVEPLLEQAAALGRTSASVLLLDYKNAAALQTPTPGGQLDKRFAALENAFDF